MAESHGKAEKLLNKGQYQLDQKQFKASKSKFISVVPLDLKGKFDFMFANSNKIPRSLYSFTCEILDKEFKNEKGAYFMGNDAVVHVMFEKLPMVPAKARVSEIARKISDRVNDNGSDKAEKSPVGEPTAESSKYGDAALRKVMEGKLPVNPNEKMIDCWISRVTSDLSHSVEGKFWTVDLLRLAKEAPIKYRPVWGPQASMILANFVAFLPTKKAETSGEFIRRDVCMLVAAALETLRLSKRQEKSLVVVPVNYRTLQNKDVVELYSTLLAHVPKALQGNLLLELKGVPSEGISSLVKEHLSKIKPFFKAVMVESGLLKLPDVAYQGFSPHAYGVELRGHKFSADQLDTLLKKYVQQAKAKGVKCYLKGVDDRSLLKKAGEYGFDYLAGTSVCMDRNGCIGMVPFRV